jgi:hypothetical protein
MPETREPFDVALEAVPFHSPLTTNPMQERELTRIRNAGGFVSQFGRVNGNLNLSRSIGDLKYKQVPDFCRRRSK